MVVWLPVLDIWELVWKIWAIARPTVLNCPMPCRSVYDIIKESRVVTIPSSFHRGEGQHNNNQ